MDFSPPPRRPKGESIVPMINVVFLLLIFFLMTSQIVTPDPFDISVPTATREDEATADPVLYISATNTLHFDGVEGPDALARIKAVAEADAILQIKADAALEASALAATLTQLTTAGFSNVEIVVAAP
ncbi:MAG: biopolymer transporter ExbD [Pseudomonadota bacterium]